MKQKVFDHTLLSTSAYRSVSSETQLPTLVPSKPLKSHLQPNLSQPLKILQRLEKLLKVSVFFTSVLYKENEERVMIQCLISMTIKKKL